MTALMEEKKGKTILAVSLHDIDPDTGLEWSGSFPFSSLFSEEDGIKTEGDLTGDLSFTRHGDDVYVTGKASARFVVECGRCLTDYEEPIDLEIQAAFFPAGKEEDSDGELYTYEGDLVELDGLLREQFLLALPLRQVCSEDCKGLCPKCGVNRNEIECGCDTRQIDERLAVLKKLKEN